MLEFQQTGSERVINWNANDQWWLSQELLFTTDFSDLVHTIEPATSGTRGEHFTTVKSPLDCRSSLECWQQSDMRRRDSVHELSAELSRVESRGVRYTELLSQYLVQESNESGHREDCHTVWSSPAPARPHKCCHFNDETCFLDRPTTNSGAGFLALLRSFQLCKLYQLLDMWCVDVYHFKCVC